MSSLLSEDLLIGADQASFFTGLSKRTIYHLVENNEIPFRRLGARLYFRKSELNIGFSAGNVSENHLQSVNENVPGESQVGYIL